MDKKLIVHLRLYRGEQLLYNGAGGVTNENQIYKVEYGTKMWQMAVSEGNLRNEYGIIRLEKVVDLDGNIVTQINSENESPIDLYAVINKEVEAIHKGYAKPKSDAEKQLDELKALVEMQSAQIADLQKGSATNQAKNNFFVPDKLEESTDNSNKTINPKELEELQAEYFKLKGEKAHHLWKAERLKTEIANLK